MTEKTFTSEDYSSNDGMLTTIWGPSMWHVLHTISFNYPVNPTEKDKKNYMQFIMNLKYILPCGKCRKNLRKNFKDLPLKWGNMQSRATFSKYVYELHEKINTMLGKQSGLSYEDVRERYEHFRARCALPYKLIQKNCTKSKKMRKNKTLKIESGCVEPLYGEKAKCVLHVVPQTKKCNSFDIDHECIKKKITTEKDV